ncbi:peptidylprolyl isomerase [Chloroflexota bacterium]
MAKKKRGKAPREVTKHQVSRWQQERKRQRLIRSLGIFIIAAVLCVIGFGWYTTFYRPLNETVIRVNDASFNMNYYINMLKYYGQGQSTTDLYSAANQIGRIIEESELVRQGALKLGISVSDDEVSEELESNDLPLSREYRDLVKTEMLVSRLLDEHFEHQVPVFAEQRHILAMFLESESQALEVTAQLEAGEDFAELAGELSLDGLSKARKGDLGWQTKDVLAELLSGSIPVEYAFSSEVGMLSQPLYDEAKTKEIGYWLIKVLERKEDSDEVHLQVIQLSSEEQANEVRARLEAGEDFAELAGEFSQMDAAKENGGDIGWLPPGLMSPALEGFAFDPKVELQTISKPIRDDNALTTGGYWLIKVLAEEDNRKIEDEDRKLLKGKALGEWIASLWDDPENKIEDFLDGEKIAWAIERAARS